MKKRLLAPISKASGLKLLMFLGGGLLVLFALAAALFLAGVWIAGGLNTSGRYLDWAVVGAVAAIVSAAATALAAAAIGLAGIEFDRRQMEALRVAAEDRKNSRVARQPYIRADIAFADRHEANFVPPDVGHVYSLSELGLADEAKKLREPDLLGIPGVPLDSDDSWASFDLVLWLSNLQTEPLGIADDVNVTIWLSWLRPGGKQQNRSIEIRLAYLAPGATTAIRICRPPAGLLRFAAAVTDLRYADIVDAVLYDYHGAMEMLYNGVEVRNERKVRRREIPGEGEPQP